MARGRLGQLQHAPPGRQGVAVSEARRCAGSPRSSGVPPGRERGAGLRVAGRGAERGEAEPAPSRLGAAGGAEREAMLHVVLEAGEVGGRTDCTWAPGKSRLIDCSSSARPAVLDAVGAPVGRGLASRPCARPPATAAQPSGARARLERGLQLVLLGPGLGQGGEARRAGRVHHQHGGAAVLGREVAGAGVGGGAVEPEVELGDAEDGVVEHGQRGRRAPAAAPACRMRSSTSRESIPTASSRAWISEALSLQSPKRRASTWSTRYGLKPWMPNSSPT